MSYNKLTESKHLNQLEKQLSKLNRVRRKLTSRVEIVESNGDDKSIVQYLKKIANIDKHRMQLAKNMGLDLGGAYE